MTCTDQLQAIADDVAAIKARVLETEESAVARLKKRNANLRAELQAMKAFYNEQSRKHGTMPQETYAKLAKCLHPDAPPPTVEQRTEAYGLLSQWRQRR